MIRRRAYGGEILKAIALVAPKNKDGTFYTSTQIVKLLEAESQNNGLPVANVIQRFKDSKLNEKQYAYSVANNITELKSISTLESRCFYYDSETNGYEIPRDSTYKLKNGTYNRYIIVCGTNLSALCKYGQWLYAGYCTKIEAGKENTSNNPNLRYVYHNSLEEYSEGMLNYFGNVTGEINFDKNITKINKTAFYYCENIYGKLDIPDTVTEIGPSCFRGCKRISDLHIPNNPQYTKIETYSFAEIGEYSKSFKLNIPDNIKIIDPRAFTNSNYAGELNIPIGVESLGDSCFAFSKVNKVIIPSSITSIGDNAFAYILVNANPEVTMEFNWTNDNNIIPYDRLWGIYISGVKKLHALVPKGMLSNYNNKNYNTLPNTAGQISWTDIKEKTI